MNFRPSRPRKRRFGSLLRRVLKSESGSMITVAAVLPLLLGTAGLAIDTGRLYVTKRQMENAADAAALALCHLAMAPMRDASSRALTGGLR